MFFLSAIILSAGPRLGAQITELRDYHGKTISCMLSGLRGFAMPCGLDGDYAYILIGSVLSVADESDDEKRLRLQPEEIFLGDPAGELTVTTNQGDCLGEITPGDRWLFYLQRNDQTNQLTLAYGSGSGPVAGAEGAITQLQRLVGMTNLGIIRGSVQDSIWQDQDGSRWEEFRDVVKHKIVATKKSDGTEHWALTDKNGNYEFEPLPTGRYHLSANTADGLWAEEGSVDVDSQSCSFVPFELRPAGRISGHIANKNGIPFKIQPWVDVVSEELGEYRSVYVNEEGDFQVNGLRPSRYLVGVGIQAEQNSPEWQSRVYYPGVSTRESAVIIELGQGEKRTGIDFSLPHSH